MDHHGENETTIVTEDDLYKPIYRTNDRKYILNTFEQDYSISDKKPLEEWSLYESH